MTTPATILLTGATDGIGLEVAKRLAVDGHSLRQSVFGSAGPQANADLVAQIEALLDPTGVA